jgi:hypothetical protein
VEIYEPILKDSQGKVTTGLLRSVGYLKDNRLLPHGFDKATANEDVAVTGDAANDPGFTDSGSSVRYVVSTGNATGPFKVEAELWFQPIGFRWAHNLAPYKAEEPQRMVRYYEAAARRLAVVLAKAADIPSRDVRCLQVNQEDERRKYRSGWGSRVKLLDIMNGQPTMRRSEILQVIFRTPWSQGALTCSRS